MMIKNFALVLLLFFSYASINGQNLQRKEAVKETTTLLKSKLRQNRSNPDSLLFYANKLYKLGAENNDARIAISALMAFGNAEMQKGNLQQSSSYYHKVIKEANANKADSLAYGAMSNIALIHRRLQRNDSALYYFKKVNSFFPKNDFKMPATQARMNLGMSYFQYQMLDSAHYYLRLSLKGFQSLQNQRFIATNQSFLAEVFYQKENYKKAIELADSSLVITKQINLKLHLSRIYSILSRSYKKIGDSVKAEEYALLELNNISNIPPDAKVGMLNHKYGAEMRDRHHAMVDRVKEEKKFYKSNLFMVFSVCISLLIISWFLIRKNKNTKREVLQLQQLVDEYNTSNNKATSKLEHSIILKNNAVLNSKDILYLKSDGHYVDYNLINKEKPEVDRNSLTKALEELPQHIFVRTHRSYVVNIKRIKIINSTQLMLDNGKWIPLSRTFKPGLKEVLNKE